MTLPKVSQLPTLTLSSDDAAKARISQFALLALSGSPVALSSVSQFVLLTLLSDARGYVKLENPISLNCWQPCSQYGTYSTIIYLGN